MQIFNSLLAEAADSVAKNYEQIADIFMWLGGFNFLFSLLIAIAVVVVFVFLRQKRIAQNQVNLANMMQELIDKE